MNMNEMIEKAKKYWKLISLSLGVIVLILTIFIINRPKASTQNLDQLTLSTDTSKSSSSKSKNSDSASDEKSGKVTVDVKGAVKLSGVYVLDANARVNDAINHAGGFADNADLKSVNLAAKLSDEQVIYVATIGEDAAPAGQTSNSESAVGGNMAKDSKKVNINTADLIELQTLSGIGAKKAQDIIDYRMENGNFKSAEDLSKVSGFGQKTVERLKDSITVN